MAIDTPLSLAEVERLYDRPGYVEQVDGRESAQWRQRALRDAALTAGVKTGVAWQLQNVRRATERRARDFDTIYDFGPYLIRGRVVPPVITEARDLYHQDGELTLRLSGANYVIAQQAHFSSVAPSWREYLDFPTPSKPELAEGLRPRTPAERDVWREGVRSGWTQGVEQANVMLQYGLDRLTRDFTGMLRFHRLVAEGRITLPIIASDDIALSGDKQNVVLDETILRITVLPEFNTEPATWSTWIRSSIGTEPTAAASRP